MGADIYSDQAAGPQLHLAPSDGPFENAHAQAEGVQLYMAWARRTN